MEDNYYIQHRLSKVHYIREKVNKNLIMYSGTHLEQYQEHVKIINNVCLGPLPACLTKGRQGEWSGVHPDFPEPSFALDLDAICWGKDAVKFIEKGLFEKKIDLSKQGTKEEQQCMKNYEIFKHGQEVKVRVRNGCVQVK